MSILWISKRKYMHKDLLSDRFGRYFELPLHLSRAGVGIELVLLSYRWRDREHARINEHFTIRSYGLLGIGAMLLHLLKRARNREVRIVLGSADMPYCILSVLLAKLTGKPSVCDVYDNFETYESARLPLMVPVYYRALRRADRVITFEETLTTYLREAKQAPAHCSVPNGVDPEVFRPLDKAACRRSLAIDAQIPVIGYFGSLTKQRGAENLFAAFERIASARRNALFLIAGGIENGIELPALNIRHLGLLPQQRLPEAICASDVCTIQYAENDFARFSFPQKMMEYIACGIPFVTPDIGGAAAFLQDYPANRYRIDDADSLAQSVLHLLDSRQRDLPPAWTWTQAAERFAKCLPIHVPGPQQ